MRRPTVRAVARLAGPAIAQQLFHTLVFLVDRAMLGHHSAESLASMQISGPVVWSTFSVLGAFTVGSLATIGRSVGARAWDIAASATRASIILALALGLVATGLGEALLPHIVGSLGGAAAAVQTESHGYLRVAFGAMPLLLVSYTTAVCFQARGDTRTPFLVALAGNAINVGINWVLIYGRWGFDSYGAQGAAIGSAAAMAFETVVLLGLARRLGMMRGVGGEMTALRRMVSVSGAALLERLVQHLGFLLFVAMIGALGGLAMAANQALISIESVVFLSADGFGVAAAAVVAQRLGAGRPTSAALAMRAGVAMAVVGLGAAGVIFVLAPEALLRLMTSDSTIVAHAAPNLLIAAFAAPWLGVAVVLSAALRGAGDTATALGVTFFGGLLVRLGASYLLAFELDLGLRGIWLGSTCDWVVRAVLLSIVAVRGGWQRVQV